MDKTQLKTAANQGDLTRDLMKQLDPFIDEMRQEVYKGIEKSFFFQRGEREDAYKMLRAINLFQSRLKKKVMDGKMAKQKLK